MDGDTPLDLVWDVEKRVRAKPNGITKEKLEKAQHGLYRLVQARKAAARKLGHDAETAAILAQVIGWLFVTRGAAMSATTRNLVLEGIQNDAWAKEGDNLRVQEMVRFRTAVERYRPEDGPQDLETPGLLATIAEVQK
jgi:hypothetical protein